MGSIDAASQFLPPDYNPDIIAPNYVHQTKPIRIIAIGAGISGIAFTYKASKLENVSFQLYEKNSDVGGTWLESVFPGCSCDVPAHCYTYTWVGNPNWSKVFADGSEIWQFYRKLAREYGVYEKTKFGHRVVGAQWDNDAGLWRVTVEDLATNEIFVDSAEVLINSGGILNNWKWPAIDGLHDFKGKLLHSAHWDKSYDLADKKVAVIGSGASGIQIVPAIQPVVKHLTSFNRSPTWIAGEFAGQFAPEGRNTKYTDEQKEQFRTDKAYFKKYRQEVEHGMNARFPSFYKYSAAQDAGRAFVAKQMAERLKHDPVLCDKLIPKFPLGCRRVTPGHGYLEALTADNVDVVTCGIAKVTENGILTKEGQFHELDVIITATGYDTSYIPRFPIIGFDGVNLQDKWKNEGAAAYLSVAVPGFPNYFLTTGPNAPISNGSLIGAIERQLDYALNFVQKIQKQDIKYVVISREAAEEFDEWKNEFMKHMSWSGACTSWYKNGTTDGKVIGPWPGSVNHFIEIMRSPRYEDWIVKSKAKNRFRYFGDGRSPVEANGLPLGWYMGSEA
ncbi:hypothetical protein F5884DRAFT_875183 [Xylogone sp. PMI_703]|nr:hypothetical protein F5884DRAFT_875183 [Xylogone sp. PMI_703]